MKAICRRRKIVIVVESYVLRATGSPEAPRRHCGQRSMCLLFKKASRAKDVSDYIFSGWRWRPIESKSWAKQLCHPKSVEDNFYFNRFLSATHTETMSRQRPLETWPCVYLTRIILTFKSMHIHNTQSIVSSIYATAMQRSKSNKRPIAFCLSMVLTIPNSRCRDLGTILIHIVKKRAVRVI